MAAHNGYLFQLPTWGVVAAGSQDTIGNQTVLGSVQFFSISTHNADRDTIIVDSDTSQFIMGPVIMDPIDSDTQQVIEHYIFDNDTVQYIEGTEFTDDNDTLQTIVEIVTVDSDTRQDIFELDTPFNDLHDTYQLIDNNNAEIFADTVQNIGAVFDLIFDTLQNIVETNPLAGNRRTNKNWEFLT